MVNEDLTKLVDRLWFVYIEIENIAKSFSQRVLGIGFHVADQVDQFFSKRSERISNSLTVTHLSGSRDSSRSHVHSLPASRGIPLQAEV
jgi:hypothetical protein